MIKRCTACLGAALLCLSLALPARAASEPADNLPADTLVYYTINNFQEISTEFLRLPLVRLFNSAKGDKSLLSLGMDKEDLADIHEMRSAMAELFNSADARTLFGREAGFALLGQGGASGAAPEEQLLSRFVIILGGDLDTLDRYLGAGASGLFALKHDSITVDGVSLRRYTESAAEQDADDGGAAADEAGKQAADSASGSDAGGPAPADEAMDMAREAVSGDALYAAQTGGAIFLGMDSQVIAALARGKAPSLSQANAEFKRFQPMWANTDPASLRARLFVDIGGILGLLDSIFPDDPDLKELAKTLRGIHSLGGSAVSTPEALKESYHVHVTESELSPAMRFRSYAKEFSLLRPGGKTMFFWSRLMDGARLYAMLRESLDDSDLKELDGMLRQELGLGLEEVVSAMGPQVTFSLDTPAPGSALPLPQVQAELQTRDRKVVHKLVETLINQSIKEYGEQARPKVQVAEDKSMTLSWSATEEMGIFPLVRITADAVQFSLSGAAIPPKFHARPRLKDPGELFEMITVDMNRAADLLTSAYTWGRMMVPPDTDQDLLQAVADTIDWLRNYGTLTIRFSQETADTLLIDSVLTRNAGNGR